MTASRRSYLLKVSEPSVVVPARVAALLERHTNIAALRTQARGVDPEAAAVLTDIRIAAMAWQPDPDFALSQTDGDRGRKVDPRSEVMTTGQVADRLGLTSQAVRNAIVAGRLRATRQGNRYRVTREDLEHFRATRTT